MKMSYCIQRLWDAKNMCQSKTILQVKKRWTAKHGKAPTDEDAERIYQKVIFFIRTIFIILLSSPQSWLCCKAIHIYGLYGHKYIYGNLLVWHFCNYQQNPLSSPWQRPSTCFPPTRSWSAAFPRWRLVTITLTLTTKIWTIVLCF